ncbi:hypothetical protein F3087_01900 [Nocardia colli]|uniref:DUF4333 domain-containing protein n=1 Tax=Nocardia colli TaxID=2545717 RepID=A0A5N0EM48_9NOCA|nr:hypothetical protein [Nocardia colli]KAA8890093.1 hypothetical protein F3087_01900 [Nocardia colli]
MFAAVAVAACVSALPINLATAQEFAAPAPDKKLCQEAAADQETELEKAVLERPGGPQVTCIFTNGSEETLPRKDGSACLLLDDKKGRVDDGNCKPIAASNSKSR